MSDRDRNVKGKNVGCVKVISDLYINITVSGLQAHASDLHYVTSVFIMSTSI